MARRSGIRFDEIGYWSEVKLDIIKEYASAYSKILAAQQQPRLYHVYIDGFAGSGANISKRRQQYVPGSPVNALLVRPRFREYHLIDVNRRKTTALDKLVEELGEKEGVSTYAGDCNGILLREVFPRVRYEDYRRGLCVLDPYGLHLNWEVIQTAGRLRSIDMFLNFPVMDMNRTVIWRNPRGVRPSDIKRMDNFWGDPSWKEVAYSTTKDLFSYPEKEDNETIAETFRKRLQEVAGFSHVPDPMPMRNSRGAVVYYLFFASQKPVAASIIQKIFRKHRGKV
jgi:three-Cys-motif partner protein